ncbi:acetylornithine deacetylase [Lutimaribacter sp. EGI FJ00015]|uniref:Acetylornithine deacetylase n=1 Tax=Lutimaribacter degradans TaxID=2945989 RepID=A0ACC5ZXC9_9RHOB|nr:acetylornithine deacetylase [Lutimaribacter sp. EGI FJ00013]MCM2562991.1 acetylornithine deacetylase [Lutimaribacter sp. EGI FJ00013]MCO0614159.1 acetylornithine deacetylase [Lutimaribacter sp. EGI FJ00015]MCO0636136.1 acetylornithine deacetylase [Lutimaribacter sp. EGI FJ00014]
MTDRFDHTVEILGDLIAFPTVSADSNLEMIAHLANRLNDAGAAVQMMTDPSGHKANLFATIGPEISGGIVLSGHSDVVPAEESGWTDDPFEMVARDGAFYGRGTCDMKGFIAAATAMAPMLSEANLRRPVHFAFTYDEEVGCLGAQHLVRELAHAEVRPATAIIGEPTMMRIIEGHKGCCEYTTRFHGLEGHGSAPDLGVSAVEYAARYVMRLIELREHLKPRAPVGSRFEPPWSTLQVGRLHGGVAHNVIAGLAEVEWELRPVQTADKTYITTEIDRYANEVLLPAMRAVHPDAQIETEVIGDVEGLEPADDNEARDIIQQLTGQNGADVVAFGTEAGLFQSLGMSAVVCGPGSIEQAHKADEYVSADQLGQCVDMLERLCDGLVMR